MRPRFLLCVCLAALVVGGAAASATDPRDPTTHAVGFGVLLDGASHAAARATAPGRPERDAQTRGTTAASGAVGEVQVHLTASVSDERTSAGGVASARDVVLAGGRVVASEVRMQVDADVGPTGATAGITDRFVAGLRVDGRAVDPGLGERIELSGLGTVYFFEQVSDVPGEVRANAVRIEVTDAAAGLPLGEQIVVGHLEAVAQEPAPSPPPKPAPSPPKAPAPIPAPNDSVGPPLPAPDLPSPARPRPAQAPVRLPALPALPTPPPLLPRRAAPEGILPTRAAGYSFPVHGDAAGFIDDYGAPRAVTEWHHGVDIFAPEGSPVLAVADGTLYNVGINTLGGNRLWLRDERGNTFYYAHLSAYAPVAVEGARVRSGEVIAFVGNTGQAITTPPHLHFEVHPGDGDSVNPYPYLLAWQRRSDVPLAFRAAALARGQAPSTGALVVEVTPPDERPAIEDDGLADIVP